MIKERKTKKKEKEAFLYRPNQKGSGTASSLSLPLELTRPRPLLKTIDMRCDPPIPPLLLHSMYTPRHHLPERERTLVGVLFVPRGRAAPPLSPSTFPMQLGALAAAAPAPALVMAVAERG